MQPAFSPPPLHAVLPAPLAPRTGSSCFRSLDDLGAEEASLMAVTRSSTRSIFAATVSVEDCGHPAALFDFEQSTCTRCGMSGGKVFTASAADAAVLAAAGAAGAAPRSRRRPQTVAAASCAVEQIATRFSACGDTPLVSVGEIQSVIELSFAPFEAACVEPPTAPTRTIEARVWYFIQKIASVFDTAAGGKFAAEKGGVAELNPVSILLSGGYRYSGFAPCPGAERIAAEAIAAAPGVPPQLAVARKMAACAVEVGRQAADFVLQNKAYFTTTQRLRMGQFSPVLTMYAALIGSHCSVMHNSAMETKMCLEAERIIKRVRPSLSRFPQFAFLHALAARFGLKPTPATSIVKQVLGIIPLGGADEDESDAEMADS